MWKAIRTVMALAMAIAVGGALFNSTSRAADYPDRPIRLILGYPAGGGTDYVARLVAQKLTEAMGQQVIVVNLPGAAGAIAVEKVTSSPPDGYTLLLISSGDTIVPSLRSNLPYNLEHDLAPVGSAVKGSLALVVNPSLPAKNVKELIALAQSEPGKLNFGSPGVGNSLHLAGALFNSVAKVDIVHVPYKGTAEAVTAIAAGQIEMGFVTLPTALPLIQAGKLRILGVTSAQRAASMPDVPTIAESGLPGYDLSTWFGVSVPAGTPKPIIDKLNDTIVKSMSTPEMKDTLNKQNLEPWTGSSDQFTTFVHNDLAQNAKLIGGLGLKIE